MGKPCPYCGQTRVRIIRAGRFICWWHPLPSDGPRIGYRRCSQELSARYREQLDDEAKA